MSEKPIHRLPQDKRMALLQRFVGHQVVLEEDVHRDGSQIEVLEGEVVSVAYPAMGTVAELVIIRRPGHWDRAISAARVRTIRWKEPSHGIPG